MQVAVDPLHTPTRPQHHSTRMHIAETGKAALIPFFFVLIRDVETRHKAAQLVGKLPFSVLTCRLKPIPSCPCPGRQA